MGSIFRIAILTPLPKRKSVKRFSEEFNNLLLSSIFPNPFIQQEPDRSKQKRKLKFDQEINKFYNEPLPFILFERDRAKQKVQSKQDRTLFNLLENTLTPPVLTVPFLPTITLDRFNRTRKISLIRLDFNTANKVLLFPNTIPEDTLLSLNIGLPIGLPTKIADAIVTTGTERVSGFSVIGPPVQHKVTIYQKGATALSGNIEITSDGGTTWLILAAFNLITNPVISFEVSSGIIYRLNVGAITTTPADIFAVLG